MRPFLRRHAGHWMLTLGLAAIATALPAHAHAQAGAGALLVMNKASRTLGIIDPATHTQVAEVPIDGVTGHEVAASPDGTRAYVPVFGNAGVGKPGTDGQTMAVVDLAARKVVRMVDFGRGLRPHQPVVNPADRLLYVTAEVENAVAVVDPATFDVQAMISTGQPESHMLAISRDGRRGYTANVGPGTVSVLDLANRRLEKVIEVAPTVQRISLSVDDRFAFTADQSSPRLAVIDTATNTVARWIALPAPAYGTAPTADGKHLVAALPSLRKVAVINLSTDVVEHLIDVPAAPQFIIIRPDGAFAYASCDADGKVAAIRTSDWTVAKVIDAGKMADGMAWAAAPDARR